MRARASLPRALVPARRSQIPAPKSTPPAWTYAVTASSSTSPTSSGTGLEPVAARPVRSAPLRLGVLFAPAPRERAQERDEEERDQRVDDREGAEHRPDVCGWRVGHRLVDAEEAVDDPRLAADLGRDPACLDGDVAPDSGERGEAVEPGRSRQTAPGRDDHEVPQRERRARAPEPDHGVER